MLQKLKNCLIFLLAVAAVCASAAVKEMKMGVYVYDDYFRKVAKEDGVELKSLVEEHFKRLNEHGVNLLHLGVSRPDDKAFDEIWLPMMKKYKMQAYLQLSFAYFRLRKYWTESYENRQAEKAGKFIAKYKNCPEILGFSIREEVSAKELDAMARYYKKIRSHAGDFPIVTLHNNMKAAQAHPEPYPAYFGTDRYAFWWEQSAGGYLASPSFSLNWVRKQIVRYYEEAAKRNADFFLVVTANAYLSGTRDLDAAWDNKVHNERARKYAETNRFGWQKSKIDGEDFYWVWDYYRLPENCLKALVWTGILEGAKSFLVWSYAPRTKADSKLNPEQTIIREMKRVRKKPRKVNGGTWLDLAGREGVENYELKEFGATAKEIQPYKKLIPLMYKAKESVVTTNERKKIFNRSFDFKGMDGKGIVIHNANVGTWGARSRYFFLETDNIKIDSEGKLSGYKPFTNPLAVEFTLKDPQVTVFDFKTGKQIPTKDGKGTVLIGPGSGVILFAGTLQEFNKICLEIK